MQFFNFKLCAMALAIGGFWRYMRQRRQLSPHHLNASERAQAEQLLKD